MNVYNVVYNLVLSLSIVVKSESVNFYQKKSYELQWSNYFYSGHKDEDKSN